MTHGPVTGGVGKGATGGSARPDAPAARVLLDDATPRGGPGIQYAAVDAGGLLFEHTVGLADVAGRVALSGDHLMPASSMSTTLTAVAVLQLVERGRLALDDEAARFVEHPYDRSITIGQLLCHTSGIPNPLSLRWVHLPEEHAGFDEHEALTQVLRENRRRAFRPGERFQYSTIGYWLLGRVVAGASGGGFVPYMRAEVFEPLGLGREQMCYRPPVDAPVAKGYLARYSGMNVVKRFVTWGRLFEGYEGRWMSVKPTYANGPSFGGVFGSARAFAAVLRDLLSDESVLLGTRGRELLFEVQKNTLGQHIPMTFGWHVERRRGVPFFFEEGAGTGFHSEMRLYPTRRIATVVMANRTPFAPKKVLGAVDDAVGGR